MVCYRVNFTVLTLFTVLWFPRPQPQYVSMLSLRRHVYESWTTALIHIVSRSQVSLCGICGGQSGNGTGFSPSSSVFLCQKYSASPLCSTLLSPRCCSYLKGRKTRTRYHPESNFISEIAEHCIETYFHFFPCFLRLSWNYIKVGVIHFSYKFDVHVSVYL